ncbi:MAG: TIGR03862 family flavoprotein [Burkholderiales bacterium]
MNDAPVPAVAVVGGGPAGLMAAEVISAAGHRVEVYDAMLSAGRKFLLAGKGGLNLTHAEPFDRFLERYGPAADRLRGCLTAFGPEALRAWARDLGVETFVGTSLRVFPSDMKAAPLLRHWLHRLRERGVRFHMRHRWIGWNPCGAVAFETPDGPRALGASATVLALGGASWPRLGSDGAWVPTLVGRGVEVSPLRPANCGFDAAGWSGHLRERFAGRPVKSVVLSFEDASGQAVTRTGEFVLTAAGVEGSLIYAVASALRDAIEARGSVVVRIDLAPQREIGRLARDLARPRGKQSMAAHLKRQAGIDGVRAALLREVTPAAVFADPAALASAIKGLPIELVRPRPIDEAISSAGGVPFPALDDRWMLRALPGVFCAGEMVDWEAPTGGYLLTASFATGRAAGLGVVDWLRSRGGA